VSERFVGEVPGHHPAIGDVLLLLMLAAAATVLPLRWRGPWLLLAVGIPVNVSGDSATLFQSDVGSTPQRPDDRDQASSRLAA
jgi:hypothetical protein